MNICTDILRVAEGRPDHPALVQGSRTTTYGELISTVRRYAAALAEDGVATGDLIALDLPDNAAHLFAYLGAAWLGAASIALNRQAPQNANANVLASFPPKLILTDVKSRMDDTVPTRVLDKAWHAAAEARSPVRFQPASGPQSVLNILATSGTTGLPKGFAVTHDQLRGRLNSSWAGYGWRDGDVYFAASSFFFSVGREYPLFHLMKGNTVVLHPSLFAPAEYAEAVGASNATTAFVVPTLLKKLIAISNGADPLFPGLRVLATGGEPLDPETRRRALRAVSPRLHEVYGAAGIGMIAVATPEYMAAHPGSPGRIVPTVEARIVDNGGNPLSGGESGWLLCRGPGLSPMIGGGDSEAVAGGWYRPGDLARIDEERRLYLEGRHSDRVIRNGANLSCAEIETAIASFVDGGNVAVIAVPDPQQGEVPVAFLDQAAWAPAADLAARCRHKLGAFKTPAKFVRIETFPMTASGKIDRMALRKLAEDS